MFTANNARNAIIDSFDNTLLERLTGLIEQEARKGNEYCMLPVDGASSKVLRCVHSVMRSVGYEVDVTEEGSVYVYW